MKEAMELAGFMAAHAIWCVSGGDTLTPMLTYTLNGERQLERLEGRSMEEIVDIGKKRLGLNIMNAENAAFLYDTIITIDEARMDAIMIEIRDYDNPGVSVMTAIPYTPKTSGAFKVHRPKIIKWEGCEEFDIAESFDTFFTGVQSHKKGSEIWTENLDESR